MEEKKKLRAGREGEVPVHVPHVIEPSAGADRFTLAVLCEAYTEDKVPDAKGKEETRTVMKFHPRLAPIKAAIFPLVNKDGMRREGEGALPRAEAALQRRSTTTEGAIGRRYRRQDEAGTPFCITIDGDTMKDDTVTIRDRDTLKQERVPMSEVRAVIEKAALQSGTSSREPAEASVCTGRRSSQYCTAYVCAARSPTDFGSGLTSGTAGACSSAIGSTCRVGLQHEHLLILLRLEFRGASPPGPA